MVDDWRDYFHNRLISNHDDYAVIIPKDKCSYVPLSCPVCKFLYTSKEDEASHYEFECCQRCSLIWAYSNRERWQAGWRPSLDDVQRDIIARPKKSLKLS